MSNLKDIRNANEAMVELAGALSRRDVDALETIQQVVEGWMQTDEEAMAWRVLTEGMLDAAHTLIDLEN